MRVNQSIDDPTFLQLNDRSSELPFCCKRGHSAILPSFQHQSLVIVRHSANDPRGALLSASVDTEVEQSDMV